MPVRRHPIALRNNDVRLTRLPLDLDLVMRLKTSYAQLRESDNCLADIFYGRLFAIAPHLRSMFPRDLALQSQKLMAGFDAVIRNLESPDENSAFIGDLGRRHAAYGVKPEQYDLVIEVLVESIKQVQKLDWNSNVLIEWRTALRLISDQMISCADHDE